MNILFVNYGDFTTNSLNHIGGFANALTAAGHACIVAVPADKESISAVAGPLFIPALYTELLDQPALFPDARPADVIHAWTPREGVRKFVVGYQRAVPRAVPLIVHLEDNEEHLICSYARRPMAELRALGARELDGILLDILPDPVRHRTFLHLADAATVIVDRLREFVPATVPAHLLTPGVDAELYRPQPPDPALRSELGLADGERVIVFTGSNTFANEPEMRELYVAVRLLNQRGIRTRLVRTGFNRAEFLNSLPPELSEHVLDLGFVAKARLPKLLALADVLVQPGRPGAFNDFRLPSKLPEFLASGRPVILPPTNVGLALRDGGEALFLTSGSPEEIADRCARIFSDPDLAARMGKAGAAFARRHFDLAAATRVLLQIYEGTAGRPGGAAWEVVRGSAASDLTAAAAALAEGLSQGAGLSPAARKDLATLAADLSIVSRIEEERAERATERKLAASNEDLLRRFGQTETHAKNLETFVASKTRQLKLTRQLSGQHIRNLDAAIASLRKEISARDVHQGNLDAVVVSLRKEITVRDIRLSESAERAKREADGLKQELKAAQSRLNEARGSLNELERTTRQQIDAAVGEHRKLSRRIAEMDAELTSRDLRVRQMVGSLSWKLTAPVRDLQRIAARLRGVEGGDAAGASSRAQRGPQPALGESSADAGAATDGLPFSAPAAGPEAPVQRLPSPADPSSPDRPPAPEPRHTYTFNFDHPRSWNTSANKLLILGWCYENSGAPILGIRGRLGEVVTEGIYGSKRLDVLASTGAKQAEYCGIKLDLKTFLGDHPLTIELLHEDGWNPYFQAVVHVGKPGDATELSEYEKWCEQHESLSDADRFAIKAHGASLAWKPLFSVVMPVFNPPRELLEKAIESVRSQIYPHWELCIADDASTVPEIRPYLEGLAAADSRIKVRLRPENGHICAASNSALELVMGDFVALFDHDDLLAPTALYEVAVELGAHPDAQLIYTDEDKIDGEDRRFDPYFKPDWNPDLIQGQNYISHLSVFAVPLIRSLGGFRAGYEGSQDWDLTLRAIDAIPGAAIRHIPKILYHWRAVPGSTALQLSEKAYPVDAARRALVDHFARRGEAVELIPVPGDHWRVKRPLPASPPRVTLIIPTRNAVKFVRQAVDGILEKTDYPNYEIAIVDNGSDDPETLAYFESVTAREPARVRVLPFHAAFNYSAINNHAVACASGEIVGFLNNDVEAINRDWLAEMVSQALRPGIGAVGAMLYYPMNTVQHAGVILGLGGVAGHPFKEFPRGDQGQKNRLRLVQNYSAVTAACLVIRKDRFLETGGFNEKELPIAFNDVDLCCKLIRAGYRNLWTPYAEFYHHESATRGVDDTPEKKARFQSEIDYMMAIWADLLQNDPAYNPNLTLVGEDFSPAYLPRTQKPWLGHLP